MRILYKRIKALPRMAVLAGALLLLLLPASVQAKPKMYADLESAATEPFNGEVIEALRLLDSFEIIERGDLLGFTPAKAGANPCLTELSHDCARTLESIGVKFVLTRSKHKDDKRRFAYSILLLQSGEIAASHSVEIAEDKFNSREKARETAIALRLELLKNRSAVKRFEETPDYEISTLAIAPRKLKWTWLAAGLTVTSALTATLVSLNARSKENLFKETRELAKTEPQPASLLVSQSEAAQREALAANIMWGVTGGAAIAAMSVFLWEYLSPDEAQKKPRLVFSPSAEKNAVSLTLSSRF